MIRKMLEAEKTIKAHGDVLRRTIEQTAPLTLAMDRVGISAELARHVDEFKRHEELMRAALGPLDDLKRMAVMESPLSAALLRESLTTDLVDRFRLPTAIEVEPLLREFAVIGNDTFARFSSSQEELQRAIEAMRTPWLDAQDAIRSIGGFAELQGIGTDLRCHSAFDPGFTDNLRATLGDWRAVVTLPPNLFDDIEARTTFYRDQGLDPYLTAFPAAAFRQGLSIAGLSEAPPPLATSYFTEADEQETDEEVGFQRTNSAHDRLLRFETQIRRFIDERMKAAFGEHWIKHRVPGEMRKSWQDKRQKAQDNGGKNWSLIAYADFTDYETIITRNDNWSAVFKSVFDRPELVRESFQRLYPIRLCTMHARIITQDDELYLHVETMRLLKAIGVTN